MEDTSSKPLEVVPVEASRDVELRVAGETPTKNLANAITSHLREGKNVSLVGIGHQALGQALKAIPIVNGNLAPRGQMYCILPRFDTREVTENNMKVSRTAIVMQLVLYTFK